VIYELDGIIPKLPPKQNYWVAPDAILVGKVSLEQYTSIWFGAVLRGDIERIHIGERSNIQDRCVLHTDYDLPLTVGPNCTIGHSVNLHGCTVGANSLVGIGATVLNGATIGKNCVIAANSLITEGKSIPDNSLVMGSPGRVKRQVNEEEIAMLAQSAENYVKNAMRFVRGMRPACD
jgi:carbonic anhydrase/acetyltransferase-like protein (isoleucine patch superfamily)